MVPTTPPPITITSGTRGAYSPRPFAPITSHMETVLPLAGAGFALGWPIEWLIQRFPSGEGTAPSSRRRWVVAAVTAALFAAVALRIGLPPAPCARPCS